MNYLMHHKCEHGIRNGNVTLKCSKIYKVAGNLVTERKKLANFLTLMSCQVLLHSSLDFSTSVEGCDIQESDFLQ